MLFRSGAALRDADDGGDGFPWEKHGVVGHMDADRFCTDCAAEIFAAALQDYEWAEIVGEQTYGKGVVQYIIPFSDGSAMKLTSAKYFTPDGRSIHGVGVTPDIFVEAGKDDDTDRQLEAAVKAVEAQLSK